MSGIMERIDSADRLKAAIVELENKRALEARVLKEQIHQTYEGFKPANLLKNAIREVSASPALQDKMLNSVAAMTAGYLTNVLFQRVSHSPLKKLIGTVLQFGITNIIIQNPAAVKTAVAVFSSLITSRSARSRKRKDSEAE